VLLDVLPVPGTGIGEMGRRLLISLTTGEISLYRFSFAEPSKIVVAITEGRGVPIDDALGVKARVCRRSSHS
jgi:hypothetical protein